MKSALALFLLAALSPCFAQQVRLPKAIQTRLPNGLRIVAMEYRKAPVLAVRMEFPGGTAAETSGPAGAAELAVAMLRSGTLGRNTLELAEQFEYLGSSPSFGAHADRVDATLTLLKAHADTGLKLLAEMLRDSQFPAEELERRRKLAISGLQALADDPKALTARVSDEVVYSGHPFGALPTIESLKAITRDDIVKYAGRVITPNRAVLVMVGDFSASEMIAKAKTLFGDWPAAKQPISNAPKVSFLPRRVVVVDKPDAEQTNATWVRAAIARNHPDYMACEVADAILGGGFTSRLVEEIRVNRSLTYGISSTFGTYMVGGEFSVRTFTKLNTTAQLVREVEKVLKDAAAKGFSASEVEKVKGYLAGQFAIHLQTPEGIASSLAEVAMNDLPDNDISTWLSRLNAVTLADINRVAAQYFNPSRLSLILTCPAAKVAQVLKGLGAEKPRPATEIAR